MKKVLFFIFCFALLPVPMRGEKGLYNTWSGLIYCEEIACTHEVGHKLDDLSGWISSSDEFRETAIRSGFEDDLVLMGEKDFYAYVFDQANGIEENAPGELAGFYDWSLAGRLLEEVNGIYNTNN